MGQIAWLKICVARNFFHTFKDSSTCNTLIKNQSLYLHNKIFTQNIILCISYINQNGLNFKLC